MEYFAKVNYYVFGILQCIHGKKGIAPQARKEMVLPFLKHHLDAIADNCVPAFNMETMKNAKRKILKNCAYELGEELSFHYNKLIAMFIDNLIMLNVDYTDLQAAAHRAINKGRNKWGRRLTHYSINDLFNTIDNLCDHSYVNEKHIRNLEATKGRDFIQKQFREYNATTIRINYRKNNSHETIQSYAKETERNEQRLRRSTTYTTQPRIPSIMDLQLHTKTKTPAEKVSTSVSTQTGSHTDSSKQPGHLD